MKDNLSYRNSFTDEFNNKKFMNILLVVMNQLLVN